MTAQKKTAGARRTPTAAITQDPIAAFCAAMRAAGIEPSAEIIPNGVIHRFNASGKRGGDSGWYVLHLDAPAAGCFGDWRTGITQNWCAQRESRLSPAERETLARRIKAMTTARAAEHEARTRAAAKAAVRCAASAAP